MMRLALAVTFVAAVVAPPSTHAQVRFGEVGVNALQVVPPNPAGAYGSIHLSLDLSTNTLSWPSDTIFNIAAAMPTSIHLHQGDFGINGPEIVDLGPLTPVPTSDRVVTTAGSAVLTPAQVAAVLTAQTYIDVHSVTYPGGHVRGQAFVPWEDIGGAHGPLRGGCCGQPPNQLPTLDALGTLFPGDFTRVFGTALPASQPGLLLLSLGSTPVPYFGGVLHAFPITTSVSLVTSSAGDTGPGSQGGIRGGVNWPAGIPSGTVGVLQMMVLSPDPSVPGDLALTNALRFTTP